MTQHYLATLVLSHPVISCTRTNMTRALVQGADIPKGAAQHVRTCCVASRAAAFSASRMCFRPTFSSSRSRAPAAHSASLASALTWRRRRPLRSRQASRLSVSAARPAGQGRWRRGLRHLCAAAH